MATQQQSGSDVTGNYWSGTSTKNNGGSALRIKTTNKLTSVTSGLNTPTGSIVIDGTDTDKAVDAGVFAHNNKKPIAPRLTSALAEVNNTVLLSAANIPSELKSVNSIETFDTRGIATAIRAGYWNIYTGKFTTDPTVSYDDMHKAVVGTSNIDNAAHVSRSYTGRLTYLSGSANPVNKSYDSKRG